MGVVTEALSFTAVKCLKQESSGSDQLQYEAGFWGYWRNKKLLLNKVLLLHFNQE